MRPSAACRAISATISQCRNCDSEPQRSRVFRMDILGSLSGLRCVANRAGSLSARLPHGPDAGATITAAPVLEQQQRSALGRGQHRIGLRGRVPGAAAAACRHRARADARSAPAYRASRKTSSGSAKNRGRCSARLKPALASGRCGYGSRLFRPPRVRAPARSRLTRSKSATGRLRPRECPASGRSRARRGRRGRIGPRLEQPHRLAGGIAKAGLVEDLAAEC